MIKKGPTPSIPTGVRTRIDMVSRAHPAVRGYDIRKSGSLWSEQERLDLVKQVRNKTPIARIAAAHGRTIRACLMQLYHILYWHNESHSRSSALMKQLTHREIDRL